MTRGPYSAAHCGCSICKGHITSTSINRGVNELPNCLRLYSKQLLEDKYKKMCQEVLQTSWLTFSGWRPFSATGSTVKSQTFRWPSKKHDVRWFQQHAGDIVCYLAILGGLCCHHIDSGQLPLCDAKQTCLRFPFTAEC